ncbi:DUF4348 domain-containing protein [Flavobacterium soli]|uniref:DUF4348 domain-containing protein n=1 Tax=Flavobacterium soli TaxID=344881 RepID=UPI000405168F|nr:DUF4348 domain-containing protein [Flavobacterium soli]
MRKTTLIIFFLAAISCQRKESITTSNVKQTIETADCESDFDAFFKEFAKDSVFQKSHIKFPLSSAYYGGESYEELILDTIKTKEDFRYIDFTEDATAMQSETGKYTHEKIKSKNGLVYKLLGYDNGIMVSYKFEIINSCWTLVEILDEST